MLSGARLLWTSYIKRLICSNSKNDIGNCFVSKNNGTAWVLGSAHLSSTTKINVTDFSCTLYLLVIGYRECKTGKTKVNLNKLKVTGFNLLLISSIVCSDKGKVVNNAKKNSIKVCIVYQCKSSVSHWEAVAETGLVYYWVFVSQFTIFTLPLTHLCCVPPKLCISIVFNFSWDDFNPEEKWETMVLQHVDGGKQNEV